MPCVCTLDLSIDAMDVSGEHHLDVLHSVYKTRLSEDGQPIHDDTEQYKLGASEEEGKEGAKEDGSEGEEGGEGKEGPKEDGGEGEEGGVPKQAEEKPLDQVIDGKKQGDLGKCGR